MVCAFVMYQTAQAGGSMQSYFYGHIASNCTGQGYVYVNDHVIDSSSVIFEDFEFWCGEGHLETAYHSQSSEESTHTYYVYGTGVNGYTFLGIAPADNGEYDEADFIPANGNAYVTVELEASEDAPEYTFYAYFGLDEDPTQIVSVKAPISTEANYTIEGKVATNDAKGILIRNGKKNLVK